ncbi:MAG TPA: hypothetical protein VFN96_01685 [Gemmatimonadales bacterium]|nr:hypothetical protein [Gemmatimonadales bacterium]
MIAETADALREGIARGYLAPADAIAWARQQVLEGEDPATPLLGELAIAEHQPLSRILLMLGQLAWGADPERVGRIAAGLLRERLADGRLGVPAVARALYQLMRDGFAPDAEFERSARRFDEEVAEAERRGAPVVPVGEAMLRFLSGYEAGPRTRDAEGPGSGARDHLTLAVDRLGEGRIDATVGVDWGEWSGRARLSLSRDRVAGFASDLRSFAAHEAKLARLERDQGSGQGILELVAREYGRARRASIEVQLADRPRLLSRRRITSELRLVLPTEHELLGEFAADLGELLATGAGTARLRLLRRWPGDP